MFPKASAEDPTSMDHSAQIFTEISYAKTRNSYDFSEVPRRIPTAPAPCQSGHMPDRWK